MFINPSQNNSILPRMEWQGPEVFQPQPHDESKNLPCYIWTTSLSLPFLMAFASKVSLPFLAIGPWEVTPVPPSWFFWFWIVGSRFYILVSSLLSQSLSSDLLLEKILAYFSLSFFRVRKKEYGLRVRWEGQRETERERISTWCLISWPWDHDWSWKQELDA